MKNINHPFILKNGKEITIRNGAVTDAEKLRKTVKKYIGESEYIPQLPEEYTLTIEEQENWIKSFIEKENSIMLIAEYHNDIIGNIDINGSVRKAMQHTGGIGMGMLQEWTNSGLGTALMTCAVEWAKQNKILEILWLQVYTDNIGGVSLYKKMGFQESGLIKNYFKQDGKYFDNMTMSLSVK